MKRIKLINLEEGDFSQESLDDICPDKDFLKEGILVHKDLLDYMKDARRARVRN